MKRLLAGVMGLVVILMQVAGCATVMGSADGADPFAHARAFVKKDVDAALGRAQKAKDPGATYRAECYVELGKWIDTVGSEAGESLPPVGLIDAYEIAAELEESIDAGGGLLKVPEGVKARCAYIKDRIRRFILKTGAKLAPIPGVGAAGSLVR